MPLLWKCLWAKQFFLIKHPSTPVLGVKSDAFFQLVFDWNLWKGGVSKGHSRSPIPACVNWQLCHSNSLASCQAVGVTRQKGSHGNLHFAILVHEVGVNQGWISLGQRTAFTWEEKRKAFAFQRMVALKGALQHRCNAQAEMLNAILRFKFENRCIKKKKKKEIRFERRGGSFYSFFPRGASFSFPSTGQTGENVLLRLTYSGLLKVTQLSDFVDSWWKIIKPVRNFELKVTLFFFFFFFWKSFRYFS